MTGPLRLGPRRLLVVEDDPDTGNLLQLFFSSHSYEVRVAVTGQEALTEARQRTPDIVLLDINLPDLDGYEVCKNLRAAPRTCYIPIIFLSEKNTPADRVAGLSAGAQDYITKPFDLEELRLRMQNIIARTERELVFDPRTNLPTGQLIDEQIQQVAGKPGWSLVTCRINEFQPFVDSNGFAAGDNVLKAAAQWLREVVDQAGTPDDFVGQPANNTFILLTAAPDASALAQKVQQRFNADVLAHYSFMDREQGYTLIRDADGKNVQVPLMTLNVTVRPA